MKKTYSIKLSRWVLEAIADHPNIHGTSVSQKIEHVLRQYLGGKK